MGTATVAVIGEALIDLLPDGAGDIVLARPGGSPANVAVALARLDVPARFLGRTSTDRWGQRLREHLRHNGVDVSDAPVGDEPTAVALIDVDTGGQPRYRFLWEGTADRLLTIDQLPADLGDVAVLHAGSVACVLPPGRDAIRELVERERDDRIVTFDPNIRPALIEDATATRDHLLQLARTVHVVKASDEDLAWLAPGETPEDVAHDFAARDVSLVAVTSGSGGAKLIGQRAEIVVPSIAGRVVDTVGAGDTFMAGLIAGLVEAGLDTAPRLHTADAEQLRHAGSLAARAAAITVSRVGADPPTRAELDQVP